MVTLKALDCLGRAASTDVAGGYSGLGGCELFKLASEHYAGREVAYGDWLGFWKLVG